MSNVWGNQIKLSIFGESHGPGIGIVIDGLPAGFELKIQEIERQMKRRAPGNNPFSTPRKEQDRVEILSGVFHGKTTGAPLCGMIRNEDTRSHDYTREYPRPGSADLTAMMKFNGFQDYRGGGHFSGRLTAPLTFAGSVARQILEAMGVVIAAHIKQIGEIEDSTFSEFTFDAFSALSHSDFPVLNPSVRDEMKTAIENAKEEKDSVGGILECAAIGLPGGIGSPFFESMESRISSMMFSIPAVKGIEFGSGFALASMRGSQANDEIYWENGTFATKTNHNGGINGGITNGMPLVFRVVVKPTASIGKPQTTVNLSTFESEEFVIQGRHDPSIVPRSAVVIESALALCLLDALAGQQIQIEHEVSHEG